VAKADPWEGMSIEEILKKHIIDGEKRQLVEHLEQAGRRCRRWRSSTACCWTG
jgi:hypothetical protein